MINGNIEIAKLTFTAYASIMPVGKYTWIYQTKNPYSPTQMTDFIEEIIS